MIVTLADQLGIHRFIIQFIFISRNSSLDYHWIVEKYLQG